MAQHNIGLFYGSTTCYTEMAAEKIKAQLEALCPQLDIPLLNIKDTSLDDIAQFDIVLLGISTWDFGELQEDWEAHWDDIHGVDFTGKTAAIFGLGDQMGYAEWFQDAVGMLHDVIVPNGADILGYWPNEGYDFIASKALTEDKSFFVGLSLDDENQFDESDSRIAKWCEQILAELDINTI